MSGKNSLKAQIIRRLVRQSLKGRKKPTKNKQNHSYTIQKQSSIKSGDSSFLKQQIDCVSKSYVCEKIKQANGNGRGAHAKNCVKPSAGIPMVDVFCGAGGASVGLKDAGFSVKLAIDDNMKATDTYYLNHEELSIDQVLNCNIEDLSARYP